MSRFSRHGIGRKTVTFLLGLSVIVAAPTMAQLVDRTKAPNASGSGIAKSLADEIGAGRGDWTTSGSSSFIIARDPFRAIRRGRQLFQRKFTRAEGQGPVFGDGAGNIHTDLAIGAGLSDSCASCHGRPRGSAGAGGDVATRPDSRDAPHLFGLGLKEMLADEITADLRATRMAALAEAQQRGRNVTRELRSKGISYGAITARPDGSMDTSRVEGVDPDLRVRPLFAHGGTISIREFVVGAWNAEMGMQAVDPELTAAAAGARFTTPSGMVLDGARDTIEAPRAKDAADDPDDDGVSNEIPTSVVDFMEFYLLNYFKPATGEQTARTAAGREIFKDVGCAACHVPNLTINHDRRVADVETVFNPEQGVFNRLFATASGRFVETNDGSGYPTVKKPGGGSFVVRNIFTDFKRHDLGPSFYERDYDGTVRTRFLTTALWGVGSTAPYGHDGRSINLTEVILRHGGEAQAARNHFAELEPGEARKLLDFLGSLVIFPPDDTASNLDPADPSAAGFPQFKHGSIKLTVLFNDPADIE
ncbi:MAG: thiol oxidoreductase-like protein [Acidobacteria bacterium]|nr:MAG: thiol oxidoreductase-like protein [Acidobacteriota bacterium]